jgi:hypothetical protein
MAGVKGKSGRKKDNPNETPEEKRLKYNKYHREYYHRKKAEKKALAEKLLIEQKLKEEIKGGK